MPQFKKLFYVACALLVVGGGTMVSIRSWNGMVYFYTSGSNRNPAAIRRVFDFSHLEGSALKLASQERLLADAKPLMATDSVGIELGHFVLKGRSGRKEFACDAYDKVEMVFSSGDVAIHGEPARMVVEGPCVVGKDINRMAPIWIPMAKIKNEKPGDVELQFMESDTPVHLTFQNVGDQWPQIWNLDSVRLFNSAEPGLEVSVDRRQLNSEIAKNPVSFSWAFDSKNE